MTFADELRSRRKIKQQEWVKCGEEMRKIKAKYAELREEISAIDVLLNKEEPQIAEDFAKPLPIAIDGENKTEMVRKLIVEGADTGLTPAHLRKLLELGRVAMPTNYLYAILNRAKKAGHIVEREGRYYPADKEKVAS